MGFYRKVSALERSYLYQDMHYATPLTVTQINAGRGDITAEQLNAALEKACAANPGTRVTLRGASWGAHWFDTGNPVRVTEINCDDAFHGPLKPDFLRKQYDLKNGPFADVYLVRPSTPDSAIEYPVKLMFHFHHAVMDAGGGVHFVRDIFKALRGEDCIGSNSTMLDSEALGQLPKHKLMMLKRDAVSPTGTAQGDDFTLNWRFFSLPWTAQKGNAMAAATKALQAASLHPDTDLLRLRITVDLRSRFKGQHTTGNFTSAFDIDVTPESDPVTIQKQIRQCLKDRAYTQRPPDWLVKLAMGFPIRWSGMKDEGFLKKHQRGKYLRTGVVSHIGRVDLEAYSCPGFQCEDVWGIPVGLKLTPMFIALYELPNKLNMSIAMPDLMANEGRLDAYAERVKTWLSEYA